MRARQKASSQTATRLLSCGLVAALAVTRGVVGMYRPRTLELASASLVFPDDRVRLKTDGHGPLDGCSSSVRESTLRTA
jgi:hypothetical protein